MSLQVIDQCAKLIGSNEDAARLAGIRVRPYKMAAFLISGLISGLAGIVLIGRLDSSRGTIGFRVPFFAIFQAIALEKR